MQKILSSTAIDDSLDDRTNTLAPRSICKAAQSPCMRENLSCGGDSETPQPSAATAIGIIVDGKESVEI